MNSIHSTYEVRRPAVRAALKGHIISGVAERYGVHRSTLHRWVSRYEQGGSFEGLARRPGSGRSGILHEKGLKRLYHIVLPRATEFAYETNAWTCRCLIHVARRELGVKMSQPTMWGRLPDCEITYEKPERRYRQTNDRRRRAWGEHTIPRSKQAVKEYKAALCCEDESNVSLTWVLGRTWAPKGQTPDQPVTRK